MFLSSMTTSWILSHFSCACCVWFITRVLTQEVITEPIRNYLAEKKYIKILYLSQCFFCMSFWISIILCLYFNTNIFTTIFLANIMHQGFRK